jgi:hypothetical protein
MSEQDPQPCVRRRSPDLADAPTAGLPEGPGDNATTRSRDRDCLSWLVVSALAVTFAALAAAWAPKMVGLFLIGFGLLSGALLGWLARSFQVRGGAVVALSAALIAASLGGLTLRTYRIWAERTEELLQDNDTPPVLLPAGSLERLPDDVRRTFESAAAARRPNLSFASYLTNRTRPLGTWPAPWPGIFWGTEIVLGTAAGAWLSRRFSAAPALNERGGAG